MKRFFVFLVTVVVGVSISAQSTSPITLPGKGKINVETLLKRIDTKMDISNLSVCELRVLRNAFAARQGYLFESSDLRFVFNTTSWYDSLAWNRVDNEQKIGPVKYSADETAFINQIKAREKELLKNNYKTSKGIVNLDNLINPYQLDDFPDALKEHLTKYGFGIVENDNEQIFQVYERNDYHAFPNFVTTDLYLQLFHLFFDTMMRKVEEGQLSATIGKLCKDMHDQMVNKANLSKDKNIKAVAEWNIAYFAIAYQLITGKNLSIPQSMKQQAEKELNHCKETTDGYSDFLDYKEVKFPYSLFKPRGHYTRSKLCGRYFKAMMWLQSVPFGTDKDVEMQRAAMIADVLNTYPNLKKSYMSVFEPITFLMGRPDNVTILQMGDMMKKLNVSLPQLMKKGKALDALRNKIDELAEKQIRIRPKFERTSHNKINFMPQRYQPDAEVLQEMADYDSQITKRDVPMGLDVMAAMGATAAERILVQELKQDKQWEGFTPNLSKMKSMMKTIDWNACVSNKWLAALNALNTQKDDRVPYFMKTQQWDKKNLNASLASWAELKHDAILYAKQPFAAECGDGSLPAPIIIGYVEPNVPFWTKAIALLDETKNVLQRYRLSNKNVESDINALKEEAQFLLNASKKELDGKRLTNEEYEHIRYIGANFEYLSLEMIKEPNQSLMGWSDVQGTDKSIAVVADVYTANGDNNPNHSILYEGVGPAHDIYVVVEVDGYLRLMRGGVFSYREFKRPSNEQRLNDEEWQQLLEKSPNTGKPSWMQEIIVPVENKPADNETIFYGTGC